MQTHLGGKGRLHCRRRRRRCRRWRRRHCLAPGRRGLPAAQALLLQPRGEGPQGSHSDAAVHRPARLRARAERLPPARQAPAVKAVLPRQLQQARGRLRREGFAAHFRERRAQALLVRHEMCGWQTTSTRSRTLSNCDDVRLARRRNPLSTRTATEIHDSTLRVALLSSAAALQFSCEGIDCYRRELLF